jgi:hypothetical protein
MHATDPNKRKPLPLRKHFRYALCAKARIRQSHRTLPPILLNSVKNRSPFFTKTTQSD